MSRTKAINEKCKDCIYDPKAPGTWREQVEACRSEKSCALWPYRPVTVATVNITRKSRGVATDPNIEALVDSLPDEDEDEEPLFVKDLDKINLTYDNSGSMVGVDTSKVAKDLASM